MSTPKVIAVAVAVVALAAAAVIGVVVVRWSATAPPPPAVHAPDTARAQTEIIVQGVRRYAISLDVRKVLEEVLGREVVHQRHVGKNVGTWDVDRSASEVAPLFRSPHALAKGRRLVLDRATATQLHMHLEQVEP